MNVLPAHKQEELLRWLRRGQSSRAIATLMDIDRKTVLRYKKRGPLFELADACTIDRRTQSAEVRVKLSRAALDRLEDVGDQTGRQRHEVAASLIETIVKDDLFEAVG